MEETFSSLNIKDVEQKTVEVDFFKLLISLLFIKIYF